MARTPAMKLESNDSRITQTMKDRYITDVSHIFRQLLPQSRSLSSKIFNYHTRPLTDEEKVFLDKLELKATSARISLLDTCYLSGNRPVLYIEYVKNDYTYRKHKKQQTPSNSTITTTTKEGDNAATPEP